MTDRLPPSPYTVDESGLPLITQLRRGHLLKHIDLSGRGLEIGPYGHPTVFKSESDISYLDWKTREQHIAEAAYRAQLETIPETDYLVTSNDYRQFVPGTFDYIIANHVLEHVPNFIQWLSDIAAMLNPNGTLFLALPDKKFTFDKYRSNTKLSHLLSDFYDRVETISSEHLLDAEIYYDLEFVGQPMVVTERLDRARIEAVLARGAHIGYHCHIFQSETVLDTIFQPLIWMGYAELDIAEFVPAKPEHGGEMIIILRKSWTRSADSAVDLSSFYRGDEVTELDVLKGKLEQLEKVNQTLLLSKSWRLTAPLRRIASLFQKVVIRDD